MFVRRDAAPRRRNPKADNVSSSIHSRALLLPEKATVAPADTPPAGRNKLPRGQRARVLSRWISLITTHVTEFARNTGISWKPGVPSERKSEREKSLREFAILVAPRVFETFTVSGGKYRCLPADNRYFRQRYFIFVISRVSSVKCIAIILIKMPILYNKIFIYVVKAYVAHWHRED